MQSPQCPVANPVLVLREEFDEWAILFDPDTGEAHACNPISAFAFKRLDGRHGAKEIVDELRAVCEDVPADAEAQVQSFIDDLVQRGYAGYEKSATA